MSLEPQQFPWGHVPPYPVIPGRKPVEPLEEAVQRDDSQSSTMSEPFTEPIEPESFIAHEPLPVVGEQPTKPKWHEPWVKQWITPGGTIYDRYEKIVFWMGLLATIWVVVTVIHYMRQADGVNASQDRAIVQQGLQNQDTKAHFKTNDERLKGHDGAISALEQRLDALQPEVQKSQKSLSQIRARQSRLERQVKQFDSAPH